MTAAKIHERSLCALPAHASLWAHLYTAVRLWHRHRKIRIGVNDLTEDQIRDAFPYGKAQELLRHRHVEIKTSQNWQKYMF